MHTRFVLQSTVTALLAMLLTVGLATPDVASAQTAADSAAIRATALDYIEGFYTGDAARMERALHTDLKKRIVQRKPGEAETLQEMTADQLVQMTAGGGGKQMPDEQKTSDVTILDIYGGMASVKIVAGVWVDYMHIAQVDGEWKIVNVLWEMSPRG
ncbi:MAG: nuclear transport factor 2 family protein [Gemmatimonadetes bacterium]|nr:nuclear transport factor 2 family protein [Gemmatimonadota bacterium]